MKALRACRQSRQSKRKCARKDPGEGCEPCRKRRLRCSAATSTPAPIFEPQPETPKLQSTEGPPCAILSEDAVRELVEHYLTRIHGGCHSIFHPATLRAQVSNKTLKPLLLHAICAIGSKFSSQAELRDKEGQLAAEAKRLLHADLENICIENVQTCILLAMLSSGNCQPSSEALYVGIAISMIGILKIEPRCTSSTSHTIDETSRRVWWSLYIAERWCSSGLGIRCRLDDAEDPCESIPPMDEHAYHALLPEDQDTISTFSRKSGIWAYMLRLVSCFAPIQDLNRRIAKGQLSVSEIELRVVGLEDQLDSWQIGLPSELKMNVENLGAHLQKNVARQFLALHLTYHHFTTLLYFHFLEGYHERTVLAPHNNYTKQCKYHASSFSNLLRLSRQMSGSAVEYPTIGHMAAVSSSVLVHVLLFGDLQELPDAREKLDSNFDALMELRRYWPATEAMIHRLKFFQSICLFTLESYKLDVWMVRFLLEHSRALERRELKVVPPDLRLDGSNMSPRTEQLSKAGRYTDFSSLHKT
ncbi:fungal-specific transcription factor domain-containing protein [Colletotrichum phormii]|uniref:Fungal-specific transcription factor domain-containing protein n=1 Tax=Colletotrichum phormii TaxID=359342 RepID=A0AAI9ZDS4_9PEZI|nr:fungal-specific transcription factor domain-containing protein [Colletotrichum phormii]KAK1621745.1 fungal-specific transcription factor domain-containing protein [Colletotrichum phormii]